MDAKHAVPQIGFVLRNTLLGNWLFGVSKPCGFGTPYCCNEAAAKSATCNQYARLVSGTGASPAGGGLHSGETLFLTLETIPLSNCPGMTALWRRVTLDADASPDENRRRKPVSL